MTNNNKPLSVYLPYTDLILEGNTVEEIHAQLCVVAIDRDAEVTHRVANEAGFSVGFVSVTRGWSAR